MTTIAAVCPVHGVFESRMFRIEGRVLAANFQGNVESCPTCGRRSKTIEGLYTIDEDAITPVSAPAWSVDALDALQARLKELREVVRDTGTPEALIDQRLGEVEAALGTQNELLAELVKQGIKGKARRDALTFIVGLIGFIASVRPAVAEGTATYELLVAWIQSMGR